MLLGDPVWALESGAAAAAELLPEDAGATPAGADDQSLAAHEESAGAFTAAHGNDALPFRPQAVVSSGQQVVQRLRELRQGSSTEAQRTLATASSAASGDGQNRRPTEEGKQLAHSSPMLVPPQPSSSLKMADGGGSDSWAEDFGPLQPATAASRRTLPCADSVEQPSPEAMSCGTGKLSWLSWGCPAGAPPQGSPLRFMPRAVSAFTGLSGAWDSESSSIGSVAGGNVWGAQMECRSVVDPSDQGNDGTAVKASTPASAGGVPLLHQSGLLRQSNSAAVMALPPTPSFTILRRASSLTDVAEGDSPPFRTLVVRVVVPT